jgi:deazaflavin-dependent oxidoreductase (nitroreductase family)
MTEPAIADPATADRMRRQARLMRLVNVPMRRLLKLPFTTPLNRRLMLLTFTGRKTGRVYQQPVSYVADGPDLLSPGGGRWTSNLSSERPIRIRLRGRDRRAVPELVREPAEVTALLQTMLTANPRLASFVPVVDSNRQVDQAKLANALGHGFCIIRWHLDAPARHG